MESKQRGALFRDCDHVARFGKELSMTPENLAHDSFDPVSTHSRRDLSRHGDSEPGRTTFFSRQHRENEVGGMNLPPRPLNTAKIDTTLHAIARPERRSTQHGSVILTSARHTQGPGASLLLVDARDEPMTTLGPASRQDFTAVLACHTCAEAMGPHSTGAVRLISALQGILRAGPLRGRKNRGAEISMGEPPRQGVRSSESHPARVHDTIT
jgi:hypothetical protein